MWYFAARRNGAVFPYYSGDTAATVDGADGTPPSTVAVQDLSRLCGCVIKNKRHHYGII